MKKLIYLIVAIAVLGLIVPGCIPVVPPTEQSNTESLTKSFTWNVPGTYSTIQETINAAAPGDTILAAAGTYTENVVIAKSLDLIGANSATTIIDGGYVGNTVTITASDVTLSGFTIIGGYTDPDYPLGGSSYTGTWVWTPLGGVVIDGNNGSSTLTGITIEDNVIHSNYGNGIFVSAAANVAIRNNEIYNNGEPSGAQTAGISITYLYYQGQSSGETWEEWRRPDSILVENNNIYDNHEFGIYLCSAKDCVILLNEISNSSRKGLLIAASMPCTETPAEYNIVEQNEIHDNDLNGIKIVSYNHHNTFTENIIYGNGYGADPSRDDFKYGFLFQDGNDNILDNNIITGNAGGGLYLWGKGDPSYTWYSTTDNTITGNTISNHITGGHGIYIPTLKGYPNSGFLNSTINCNNITNNSTYGLENADTTQTINAENNWWGDASGPYHSTNSSGTGDAVSDNVDFIPWLGDVPVIDSILINPLPAAQGETINLTANFTGPTGGTVTIDWGDGTPEGLGYVDDDAGTVTGSYIYPFAGVYTVTVELTITNDCVSSYTKEFSYAVVYDPSEGFVTGGGWINSPVGASSLYPLAEGKAIFGFVSKYKKGQSTPTGNTEFQFNAGDLNFHSDSYDWLVIANHKAMYKGTGTINGAGAYGFMLSAIDEKLTPSTDVDMFRIKIWDKDDGDVVVYDNNIGEADDADPTTEIAGGQIVIHKGK